MTAKIIDGKKISQEIRSEITKEVGELKRKLDKVPGLAVVLVGNDPASEVYVKMKFKGCTEVGIRSIDHKLPEDTSEEDLIAEIDRLNRQDDVHGILVQLPLPSHINEGAVLDAVNPLKDVDGFHPVNIGRLVVGQEAFMPCTPAGIQQLLLRSGYKPEGKHVVIVGRSNIVGKPMSIILMQKNDGANATVTVCHSRTVNLDELTREADILVVAIGVPEFLKKDMVSEKAVVIDVGVNRIEDKESPKGYRIVGDVAFEEVKEKVKAITPVPGGVGPMTVTMVLANTLKAFKILEKQV